MIALIAALIIVVTCGEFVSLYGIRHPPFFPSGIPSPTDRLVDYTYDDDGTVVEKIYAFKFKRMFRTSVSRASCYVLPTIVYHPYIRAITFQWGYKAWQFSPTGFR